MDAEARENARLMLSGLMQFAKFKGWIVDRKQVASAKLDFGKISRADLDALMEQHLPALALAARDRIKRIAAGAHFPDARLGAMSRLATYTANFCPI